MPPPAPHSEQASAAPDPRSFAWLPVPVAWCDLQGRLLGANAAFEAFVGSPAGPLAGQPLAHCLALQGTPAAAALLAGGDAGPLPWSGRGPQGQALSGQLSLRGHPQGWVVTLQPAPDPAVMPSTPATLPAPADPSAAPSASPSADPSADALQALRLRMETAQTLVRFGTWTHDLRSGNTQWDAHVWHFWGLAPQPGALSLTLAMAAVHPDDRAAATRSYLDSLARPGSHSHRYRLLAHGGQMHHVRSLWHVQADDTGRPARVSGIVVDDTETVTLTQAATAAQSQLNLAMALADIAIWQHDDATDLLHTNDLGWALLGLAPQPGGLPMARVLDLLHPDDQPALAAQLSQAARAQARQATALDDGPADLGLRCRQADGRWRYLLTRRVRRRAADGRLLGHVGVALDLTERFDTEQRLRQANERAALVARGVGIGTWEADGRATSGWWDEQMFRLRGRDWPACQVQYEDMLQWLHPADRQAHRRQITQALDEDRPSNIEFRVVWPDGTVRWLASRSTPVRDETGQTVRRIGINWDITDARNADAARQERLLAQRESQAKARFLARISHELRTPLNAVLGYSQLLLADTAQGTPPDPATWRRRVEQVQASGEHLLALIDDVLELSSLESGELPLSLQPVDLAPLVRSSLPLVENLAQQHQVALTTGPLAGWAQADPVRLRQVLLNLLSNAIKYTPPGGRVAVSTEASGGWLLMRVEDTGRGLSDEQLRHLFEPFNRLGAERDGIAGTGIGLAIVQAAMQQMGGTVQVRSQPGVGSVFELSLQQAAAAAPADAPASAAPLPAPVLAGGGPLLYIEDNEVNMMIVSELVRQRPDLRFVGAPDGTSGLAAARDERPVLILLDMQLPDMDGHEVLRCLRADPATAGIHCIAVSANAMPEDIRLALDSGFDDYWTKPLDLKAFLLAMDRLFGPRPRS